MVVAPSASPVASGTTEHGQVLLSIERLTKRFDETLAVAQVSLQILKGEIFALLGGSGSGKSTLLRMLAGFERPSEGRILLNGQDITERPPYERPINMMFQSYALFPHLSVEQNIAFGLKQDRLPAPEIAQRVTEMLTLVQMEKYAKRKPHQLSGGQRQRVALARSLAKRPKLLLLDEPMGALDKKLRSQMQLELVQILHDVGVTCVMVTHDQEEAMMMANRLAIMHHGVIEQVGSPIEVYEQPRNRLVCEFIGSVNLFRGERLEPVNHDQWRIFCPQLEHPVCYSLPLECPSDVAQLTYALRPEQVQISTLPPAIQQGLNGASGQVQEIAYLGGHSLYYVRLLSGLIVQSLFANTARQAERPAVGDTVYLAWTSNSGVVLFS